jgi:hypothetical protein
MSDITGRVAAQRVAVERVGRKVVLEFVCSDNAAAELFHADVVAALRAGYLTLDLEGCTER